MNKEHIIYIEIATKHKHLVSFFPKEVSKYLNHENLIDDEMKQFLSSDEGTEKLSEVLLDLILKSSKDFNNKLRKEREVLAILLNEDKNKSLKDLVDIIAKLPLEEMFEIAEKWSNLKKIMRKEKTQLKE